MTETHDTVLHAVVARAPKTSRCVELRVFQLRTRISANRSQSFYFHHSVLGWDIDFFLRISLQKPEHIVYAKLQRAAIW